MTLGQLTSYRQRLDRLRADYDHAERTVIEETVRLAEAQTRVQTALEAQRLVQETAEQVQAAAHQQIASVVSRCLATVFGESAPEFRIRFERRRGRTDAELLFVQNGREVSEPQDADSGGMVDVAALALRLACLVLLQPPLRRLVLADEPMRFVNGKEYQDRVAGLLLTLAAELDFQLILATDDPWLEVGKVVDLS